MLLIIRSGTSAPDSYDEAPGSDCVVVQHVPGCDVVPLKTELSTFPVDLTSLAGQGLLLDLVRQRGPFRACRYYLPPVDASPQDTSESVSLMKLGLETPMVLFQALGDHAKQCPLKLSICLAPSPQNLPLGDAIRGFWTAWASACAVSENQGATFTMELIGD